MIALVLLAATAINALPRQYAPLSLGNELHRTYMSYAALPKTVAEAVSAGYKSAAPRDFAAGVGATYCINGGTPTEDDPLCIGYNPAGQITSMTITIWGDSPPQKLIGLGWWRPSDVGGQKANLTVSFRSDAESQSNQTSSHVLGDRIIVNGKHAIPLTSAEAAPTYMNGSCFESMGWHAFHDVEAAPSMSWKSENLSPIVPMYAAGRINAIFFTVPFAQQSVFSGAHEWEAIPLPNTLMCKNTCSSDCHFDNWLWSTMHIYFGNYKNIGCPNGCTIGCCEK
eukprot:TRINITY_DN1463_c0_g1_i1.p1 TRINITY_DN1463_c0_g1~~TRINITY_DN1463_c0_g1_i1.p1  ORF type:complete len:296 (-),score=72.34 TRINITY_DN1463_c0_g1_i1:96-941(-)